MAMAFLPSRAVLRPIAWEGYSCAGASQRRLLRAAHTAVMPGLDPDIRQALRLALRIPRHQPAIDRNDCAGQERRRGQAQAQRHMRDLLGIAIAAERGAALGIDLLVLLGNPVRDRSPDRPRADA